MTTPFANALSQVGVPLALLDGPATGEEWAAFEEYCRIARVGKTADNCRAWRAERWRRAQPFTTPAE